MSWNLSVEIYNGTKATVTTSPGESTLRVLSISRNWAGKYICRFISKNFQWDVSQFISFPLLPEDIIKNPAQVSVNCDSFSGLTLRCCVRNEGQRYNVSWSPDSITSAAVMEGDLLCHSLNINTCPKRDTFYQCAFQNDVLPSVEAELTVLVIQPGDSVCPSEYYEGMWNATKAGGVAEILCPEGKVGKAMRNCSINGIWGNVISNCTSKRLKVLLQQAQWLRDGLGDPQIEIAWMIEELRNETLPDQGIVNTSQDLIAVLTFLESISHIAVETNLPIDISMMDNFIAASSQIFDFDYEKLWFTACAQEPSIGSNVLQSMENITRLLVPDENNFYFIQSNVEMQGAVLSLSPFVNYSKFFNLTPAIDVYMSNETLQSILEMSNITVISTVFKKIDKILPLNFGEELSNSVNKIDSLIMTNTIIANNERISQAEIHMTFGHMDITEISEKKTSQCVFWNYNIFEGVGGWSTHGCQAFQVESRTVCKCQHLTSFSILMSISNLFEDHALELLSRFGVCASIISLILCIVINLVAWKSVVTSNLSFFRYTTLINIALSLLIANAWFLGSSYMIKSHNNKLCVAAAFFNHLFYLVMFFWMLFQALMLFHQLVFVFHQLQKRAVVPIMLTIGYLCPVAIAVFTLSIYYPEKTYLKDGTCWLNGKNGALYAFAVPVLIIVMVNTLIVVVVVLKLLRPSVSESHEGEDKKALIGILKAVLILTPVFGLTWGLGIVTIITEIPSFFHYLFTLLNAFQGVFILIFGCLLDKKPVILSEFSKKEPEPTSLDTEDDIEYVVADILDVRKKGKT
ncbi:adhesion G-protein coupled receptor F3 [Rhinatrema bivittatum]|uniref:adhesion G-protein coupled receptor F3 n=1 Tax=Rhinatrema bivittatum TaxID=194408 RepID=UPI001126E0DD|nr:adhesion G-protein coupled receptor F3 [Rhinatrema bivittatum]